MLKYTGVELELITDPDMHQIVGRSMRGVLVTFFIGTVPRMIPTWIRIMGMKPRTLTYQDANSLYSWATPQLLPLKGFKWVPAPDDVDMEYPNELHDEHNLYPLAPGHAHVTDDMLSPFQREHFPPIRGSIREHVLNLHNNKKYVLHYRNLQLYVSLGMKIKRIHRLLQF